jgi:hypothetical protein
MRCREMKMIRLITIDSEDEKYSITFSLRKCPSSPTPHYFHDLPDSRWNARL